MLSDFPVRAGAGRLRCSTIVVDVLFFRCKILSLYGDYLLIWEAQHGIDEKTYSIRCSLIISFT